MEDAIRACDAAAAAFPIWSQMGPNARRQMLMKASQALEAKGDAIAAAMAAETGASGIWAGFNVHLSASMLLEAASLTTQINGEIIPSDVPGSVAMAVRQPAGVVLGIAPGMPRDSGGALHLHRTGLRQHRDSEGLRAVSCHPRPDH